jgi:hypothetical protein
MAAKGEAGQALSLHAQPTGWLTVGRRTGSGGDPGGRVVDRGPAGQVRIHRLVGVGWVRPATRTARVLLVEPAPGPPSASRVPLARSAPPGPAGRRLANTQ